VTGHFVVTTRSRLRGVRFLPGMRVATRRVMRDLHATGDATHAVSVIANPREFWTVSVWSSRHQMQEFMRSGAHGQFMWEVGTWLESFWLMRWTPTRHEVGAWEGDTLAPPLRTAPAPEVATHPAAVDEILASIPRLRDAFGPHGAPDHAHAPDVRRQRDLVAGAAGVLMHVPGRRGAPGGRRYLRQLAKALDRDEDLLRLVMGSGQYGAGTLLLGVWRSDTGSGRLLDSDWITRAQERWGSAFWACELLPDNEFGHWDGLRLRDEGWLGELGPTAAVRPSGRPR
jgi:hypothetical protein